MNFLPTYPYSKGCTIKLSFTDANSVVTSLGTTSTDPNGTFKVDEHIPDGAALGAGVIGAQETVQDQIYGCIRPHLGAFDSAGFTVTALAIAA